MKLFNLFLFFFFFSYDVAFSQEDYKRAQELLDFKKKYQAEDKIDSFSIAITNFENLKNLSSIEYQIVYHCKGILHEHTHKYKSAIEYYKKSISFASNHQKSPKYKALDLFRIANIYFTTQDYKKAYNYALLARPLLIEDYYYEYISNYSIIGYWEMENKNYSKSLENYKIAQALAIKNNDSCKLVEIEYKIAELESKTGNLKKGLTLINNCIIAAKKCQNVSVEQNCRSTKYRILVAAKLYKEATVEIDSINKLTEELDYYNRDIHIDKIETVYKTKLKNQENISLKNINLQKDKVVKNQKIALIITVFGIVILFSFLYWVYKLKEKQKEQNIIIEKSNNELKRLHILNQKIFSVISHDFKAPISTLRFLLEKDETNNAYIKDINNQLKQSDNMLNSLLDWAKTELTNSSEKEEINLLQIANFTISNLQKEINNKNIEVNSSINENDLVFFNKSVLQIVFRNILNNAIKYSFSNGKIDISFSKNSITVRDYGKGIEEKKISKLLTQQVFSSLGTYAETGFGLGLYLCNELMLKNNGEITYKNLAEGSEFNIILN